MLGNYKIRVNNEVESKEVQELFFELGYEWNGSGKEVVSWRLGLLFTKDFQWKNCLCYFDKDEDVMLDGWVGKELTLPELRELVVLRRNDATHVGNYCGYFYVTCDGDIYSWEKPDVWKKNNYNTMNDIKPIQAQPAEKGLISRADALRALEDGKDVEFKCGGISWRFLDAKQQPLEILIDPQVQFRLKPQTIKFEVEIPKPFKPKVGDYFYVICPISFTGYTEVFAENEENLECFTRIGAWRSPEEIKQVVTALRSGIKGIDNV